MYCRNCGNEMPDGAEICMKCGVPVGKGRDYCWNCGKETVKEAVVCVSCGAGLVLREEAEPTGDKSAIAAGLLAIFLGSLGVHNFYLGFKKRAFAQLLLTIGGAILSVLYVVFIFLAVSTYFETGFILLAILSLLLGIACVSASSIWALIEGILYLCGIKKTDGKGNLLRN